MNNDQRKRMKQDIEDYSKSIELEISIHGMNESTKIVQFQIVYIPERLINGELSCPKLRQYALGDNGILYGYSEEHGCYMAGYFNKKGI